MIGFLNFPRDTRTKWAPLRLAPLRLIAAIPGPHPECALEWQLGSTLSSSTQTQENGAPMIS